MCSDKTCALLVFDDNGGGECPVQWEATHEGHHYYIRYRHSWLTIDVNLDAGGKPEVFAQALAPEKADDGRWSDRETNVYLHLIGEAIRRNALSELIIPKIAKVQQSEHFEPGLFPRYMVTDENGAQASIPASALEANISAEKYAAHTEYQRSDGKF